MAPEPQLAFTREEYARRLTAVRDHMRRLGADILLVDEKEHLGYLTGFTPSATMYQACVIPLEQDPIMILRRLDEHTFTEVTWLADYVLFGDGEDPIAVLAATLRARGWADKRIAVEFDSHYLTIKRFEAMRAALPSATFVDFSGVLWELRLIKSPEEIAYLRQAAAIADEAMRRSIAALGEGVSERVAAITAASTYLEMGADSGHVGPIAGGNRTNSLHGGLRDHRLQRGDLIHLELCPMVRGYSARMMRPAVIGAPSPEQEETARQLIAIQDQQFAALRPGVVAKDVDRIAREQVLSAGLRDVFDNTTGYTLGYYTAPYPPRTSDFTRVFLPTSEWQLEAGMVFHMYLWARGMAFSETILITDDGHERLTKLERQLFVR